MSAPSPSLPPPPYEKAIRDAATPLSPPIIRTPHSPPPPSISPNTRELERQVHQVVNIMESNLERVMERGENLDSLNHRAQEVSQGTMHFHQNAASVRRRLWWKNVKINFLLCLTILTILIIIGITFLLPYDGKQPSDRLSPPGNAPGTNPDPPPIPDAGQDDQPTH